QAKRVGPWTQADKLKGYVGHGYVYASANSGASIRYEFQAPAAGKFDIRVSYQPYQNRGQQVPVTIETPGGKRIVRINQRETAPLPNGFLSVGEVALKAGEPVAVTISTEGAGGVVHADAVQIVSVP